MQTLDEIIHRSLKKALNEIHHAQDNGLFQVATKITEEFIEMYDNGIIERHKKSDAENPFYKDRPFILYIDPNYGNDSCAIDVQYNKIIASKKSIENNSKERLASLIFHELGHAVNYHNGGIRQNEKDFEQPLFLSYREDEYRETLRTIYLFYTRELKARCFETTMFLKQLPDTPLKQLYDERCTGLNKMKAFINRLTQAAREGQDGKDSYLIEELSGKFFDLYSRLNNKPSWNDKCRVIINWFTKQYQWLKKRVDKIYYDAQAKQGNFE
jgi:hypothetical protein